MPEDRGHIELERRLDSITVGVRHRKDPGDMEALMTSIDNMGLLQPITITPDGVLVCGWRRLEAVRRLGWDTLKVWVRSGISDELSHLLAQQDENQQRKPLTELEASHLYREVKRLIDEETERKRAATCFGADGDLGEVNGSVGPTEPRSHGEARAKASILITGTQSFARHEQVAWIERVSLDGSRPESVREFASNMLAEIEAGGPVEPAYKRVKAAVELASEPVDDLDRLAAEALARVRQREARKGQRGLTTRPAAPAYRSVRSFLLTWGELEGWSKLYEVRALVVALSDEEFDRFDRVVAETVEFAERLRAARDALVPA